jgi:hypothetical protein
MSLFEELKRRNVFRVGIAYTVTAWLILQVADIVLGNSLAPEWVMHVIMLLLAIGLPIALLFAWAFQSTPEGLKKESGIDRSSRHLAAAQRNLYGRYSQSMSRLAELQRRTVLPRTSTVTDPHPEAP